MAHTLASLALLLIYIVGVHKLSSDFRGGVEPWLRQTGRRVDPTAPVSLSTEHRPGEVVGVGERTVLSWASVVVAGLAVFLPVLGLGAAAHFRAISWVSAYRLLGITLMLASLVWVIPRR